MKAKKSDSSSSDQRLPIAVTIHWEYCNEDENDQVPWTAPTQAKYKKDYVHPDPNGDKPIKPGECVQMMSKKNINLCKRGAKMSMLYEGTMPDVPGKTYCYAFRFLRVRKQWLPEGLCSLIVSCNFFLKKKTFIF